MNLGKRWAVWLCLIAMLGASATLGCGQDGGGDDTGADNATDNATGGENGDDSGLPQVPEEHYTRVCINRPSEDFNQALLSKQPTSIPARWVKVEWFWNGQKIDTGRTDEKGFFRHEDVDGFVANSKICYDKFPPDETITTKIRYSGPVPLNNKIQHEVELKFESGYEGQTKIIDEGPEVTIREEVLKNYVDQLQSFNDDPLPTNIFPLIATHDFTVNPPKDLQRVKFDLQKKQLSYDGAVIANLEGAAAFIVPAEGATVLAPNFSDQNGVLTLKRLTLNFDYESSVSGIPTTEVLGGEGDAGKGAYSNLQIYVTLPDNVVEQTHNQNFCEDPTLYQIKSMGFKKYSALETAFINAVALRGGVSKGLVPGYFWSDSGKQAEYFNTSEGQDKLNTQAVGTTLFNNFPLWDFGSFDPVEGNSFKLALLVLEGDDGYGNDLVDCRIIDATTVNGDVNAELVVNNQSFMENLLAAKGKALDALLTDPAYSFTLEMVLGYAKSVKVAP